MPQLGPQASGTIKVVQDGARKLVRIFHKNNNGAWQIVNETTVFRADELKKGLTLGIDARDTRRPEGWDVRKEDLVDAWDGRTTIQFSVADGEQKSQDRVMLRVAPVVTHHHAQRLQKVFTYANPKNKAINDEIDKALQGTGIEPMQRIDAWNAPRTYFQDEFEPGFMSMPGPNGTTISMRIIIGRSQKVEDTILQEAMYVELRNAGTGIVLHASQKPSIHRNFDSTGNVETVPPYKNGKKNYPAGRVFVGTDANGQKPVITDFFRAQEVQEPLTLDSSWLTVGHVDEFVQFLPVRRDVSARGWILMVSDPAAGLKVIKEAQSLGMGNKPVSSRNTKSVNDFLHTENDYPIVSSISQRIQKSIDLLKSEIGLKDSEIFRAPVLYTVNIDVMYRLSRKKPKDIKPEELLPVSAYLPASINGLVLNNYKYIAPKSFGPSQNASSNGDIFQNAVKDAYAKVGYDVDFVDDWQWHEGEGDIHCGTNSLRDTSSDWWKLSDGGA
ncbi:hypothetical protein QQS21_008448 [Conoideocrella luteorostrata]|uniref:Protein-arginine deiminase C-terminal domain-containing protein n=1 Tax=Conoideocrella luteorostrata TaxID=1105319 RepID=A0AAJ0FWI6_9HYPO|nr:hypothetical protein QQS21_008448 [Conoideocrella luteorostrata]